MTKVDERGMKSLQLRVRPATHRKLKALAALRGIPLSDALEALMGEVVDRQLVMRLSGMAGDKER